MERDFWRAVLAFAGQQTLVYEMDMHEAWSRKWGKGVRETWEATGVEKSQRPSSLVATPSHKSSLDQCHIQDSIWLLIMYVAVNAVEGFIVEG